MKQFLFIFLQFSYAFENKKKKVIKEKEKIIEPSVPSKLFLAPEYNNTLSYEIQQINENDRLPSSHQYILTHPEIQMPIVDYANASSNTEDVKKMAVSTMVDKDLNKKVNRGMNTDLLKDKVIVKNKEPQINLYYEG